MLEWHPEVMVCRREVGENLECHEGMAVQMHEMEVPWRTHGWLTSHTQGYLTNELCDCSEVECDKRQRSRPKNRERNTTLKEKVEKAMSRQVDEDVAIISGGECHGSHISECYRDSEVGSAVGTSTRTSTLSVGENVTGRT
ncbi:hypothetical protein Prudu_323S000200 [Prunus dulcis]|uniref:Uncharacterized protein n=1 Tax=Prunus dulcis TaxID=3755 RepID=A0A5H2Y555_PRUDU|nr:hypothetical protein Prudu_323S000200 [Prunus dulcis]